MEAKTKAEIISAWLSEALDKKRDLTSETERKIDFKNLCDANEGTNFLKSHYIHIFQRILRERNIDPRAYGLTRQVPSFTKISSDDMEGATKPSPASQPKVKKIIQQTPEKKLSDEEIVQEEISDIELKFNRANVGATLKGFYMLIQWKYPYLDPLTTEEKNDLADLWLPAFEKYVKGKYTLIAIPALATFAILKGKVNKDKKDKHDREKLSDKEKKKAERNFKKKDEEQKE
jgi:hypothetical protein